MNLISLIKSDGGNRPYEVRQPASKVPNPTAQLKDEKNEPSAMKVFLLWVDHNKTPSYAGGISSFSFK